MDKFPAITKKLRLEKGLGQEQLAEEMNVSRSTVGMWETGKRNPPEYVVELIRYKIEKEEDMNRTKLLNEIKDNMYWENMFAHVWKEKTITSLNLKNAHRNPIGL